MRGVSRPLEPLCWPNQGFLLAYMAMAPLRCLSLFYNGPAGWRQKTAGATIGSSGLQGPAWLREVPAPSAGPQTGQFGRSEAEAAKLHR